jgi:hypothetical protein
MKKYDDDDDVVTLKELPRWKTIPYEINQPKNTKKRVENEKIIHRMMKYNVLFYDLFKNELSDDIEYAKYAIFKNTNTIQFMSDVIMDDESFIRYAILKDHKIFRYASNRLKSDIDFIYRCMFDEPMIVLDLDDKFRLDKKIILEAVMMDKNVIFNLEPDALKVFDFSLYIERLNDPNRIYPCKEY